MDCVVHASAPIVLGRILSVTVKPVEESVDDFDDPGPCERAKNVGPLRPMDYFVHEFRHNANLSRQFTTIRDKFDGSRAARGDGNCYYRAVLFSWLEYSLRGQDTSSLMRFHNTIERYACGEERQMTRDVQNLLVEWRRRCVWHAVDLDGLIEEVVLHFNDCRTDFAFIQLFRWVIRDFILENENQQCTDGLSLACWADASMQGGITNFCAHVETMHEEAFDLVQFVAPQVLRVSIRIVLVDRNVKDTVVVDYSPTSQVDKGLKKTSSILDLKVVQDEPQVFLLFRPGHYDVLTPINGKQKKITATCDKKDQIRATVSSCLECLEDRLLADCASWDEETKLMFGVKLSTVLDPLKEAIGGEAEATKANLMHRLTMCLGCASNSSPPVKGVRPGTRSVLVDDLSQLDLPSCALCTKPNAMVLDSPCGCGFHATCLDEYVQAMNGNAQCHVHGTSFPQEFLRRHLPSLALESTAPNSSSNKIVPAKTVLNLHSYAPAVVDGHAQSIQLANYIPQYPTGQACLENPELREMASQMVVAQGHFVQPNSVPSQRDIPEVLAIVPQSIHNIEEQQQNHVDERPCCLCWNEGESTEEVSLLPCCGYAVHKHPCLLEFWKIQTRAQMEIRSICCPAHDTMGCEGSVALEFVRIPADDRSAMEKQLLQFTEDTNALIAQCQNEYLADEKTMKVQAVFECSICFENHEVDGSCTLPCGHRFCFDSLEQHFSLLVKERRLNQLQCPVVECHQQVEDLEVLRGCLGKQVFEKLLEFMTRDLMDPNIIDCPKCEERVWVVDDDERSNLICPQRHAFCADCERGPHPWLSCKAQEEYVLRQKNEQLEENDKLAARDAAQAMGWKPCPMACRFGGGFKASEECDHVTCQCGFQFCWICGVDYQIPFLHDNRWHKPMCTYYTERSEVSEAPKFNDRCLECQKLGHVCPYPEEDGYQRRVG
eukprot:GEMP01006318.1.p1 GENE.GEMP01006318.1~~GEMP01006318.1.p1  ORF type:complete len:944 (-),score=209.82 GEMP01006318.1:910-3741(-)